VFLLLLVIQVVVLTTLVAVVTVTHQVLDHSAQHRVDMVPTVVNNMLVELAATDQVVT
tara:strand:- start:207 stop:380 length:174 start_codon:yes stop_codon:yes gene_type:complete